MISSMKNTTKVTCPLMTSGAAQSMLGIIGDAEYETSHGSSQSALPDGELPASRLYTCDPRPRLEECSAMAGTPELCQVHECPGCLGETEQHWAQTQVVTGLPATLSQRDLPAADTPWNAVFGQFAAYV